MTLPHRFVRTISRATSLACLGPLARRTMLVYDTWPFFRANRPHGLACILSTKRSLAACLIRSKPDASVPTPARFLLLP